MVLRMNQIDTKSNHQNIYCFIQHEVGSDLYIVELMNLHFAHRKCDGSGQIVTENHYL